MRGRKPKPTGLKLVEGNPGKRAVNKREPRPEVRVPTYPAHLCPAAKAEWKRLAQELFVLGIVTALDRAALAVDRQAYGRWAEAERKLAETPMLLKLPSGCIRQACPSCVPGATPSRRHRWRVTVRSAGAGRRASAAARSNHSSAWPAG